jgi:hypothetical protein
MLGQFLVIKQNFIMDKNKYLNEIKMWKIPPSNFDAKKLIKCYLGLWFDLE